MSVIPLADAPCELRKQGVPITYRKLYQLVLDGVVPAERGENGRWLIRQANLPQIIEFVNSRFGRQSASPEAA
jgi:hypothetical protein